jgi:hypothetical protein
MSTRTPAVLFLVAFSCLACSGFTEGLKQGFDEGFDKSFRESFVDSCMAERGPDLDEATFRSICTCSADGMLSKYSATELMKLSTESPAEIEQRALPIVEKCASDVMLGQPAAPAAPASPRVPTP